MRISSVGRGAHHRAELLGHLLLADEERRQAVHALEALLLRDALVPVDAVLGEVDVLGGPLLALPEVVELARSSSRLHLAAVGATPAAPGRWWPGSPRARCAGSRVSLIEAQPSGTLAGQPVAQGPGLGGGLDPHPVGRAGRAADQRPRSAAGRRSVVETELRPPLTAIVSPPKRQPVARRPSAERSSTRIEMKAGTRTTRGVIRPPSPVNSASERAGSSSPAAPRRRRRRRGVSARVDGSSRSRSSVAVVRGAGGARCGAAPRRRRRSRSARARQRMRRGVGDRPIMES